jgi:DNA-directed RNA polymerase specialized sigma24 family protein
MAEPHLSPDVRTLAADLFAECHETVLARLAARYPFVDRDLLHDAFVQALLELCACPGRFDPARGAWRALLWGAARRALRSLVRSDRRRRFREEKRAARVAGEAAAARSPLDELADRELAEEVRRAVARTEEERQVLRLWEMGVEDPGEYARALGREDNPDGVAALVKRVRDRLTARLRRFRGGLLKGGSDP